MNCLSAAGFGQHPCFFSRLTNWCQRGHSGNKEKHWRHVHFMVVPRDIPMAGLTTFRADLRYTAWFAGFVLSACGLSPCSPGVVSAEQPQPGDSASPAVAFDDYFLAQTMRVDYYHSGNAGEDRIALERVVLDGVWAGGRARLADTLDVGLYCVEVRDQQSRQMLYARGFCSVFGEWQTTAPAKQQWGTFHESLRFPWPRQPVNVVIKRRQEGVWRELWTTTVDPNSRFVVKADLPASGNVWTVFENGPTAEKVDLLFLGDGYTSEEVPKFHADTQRLVDRLFAVEPFQSRRPDFNVRAIDVSSGLSGIAQPRDGVFRRCALSCQYDTFDVERYVLTADNRTLRDTASAAPYDNLIILLNNKKYGGGGIYNDQTTVAADCAFADYIIVHEFGHHLAGLGDEYYVSNVAYETGKLPRFEPWEPNVTALLDAGACKWKDLVAPDTPIPTPWEKEAYEAASRQTQQRCKGQVAAGGEDEKSPAVSRQEQESTSRILRASPYAGRVGAFEGASYETNGLYRPAVDCLMFSRNPVGFCPVCRRAIERAIDQHTGR
jgi:hypothetical protein